MTSPWPSSQGSSQKTSQSSRMCTGEALLDLARQHGDRGLAHHRVAIPGHQMEIDLFGSGSVQIEGGVEDEVRGKTAEEDGHAAGVSPATVVVSRSQVHLGNAGRDRRARTL